MNLYSLSWDEVIQYSQSHSSEESLAIIKNWLLENKESEDWESNLIASSELLDYSQNIKLIEFLLNREWIEDRNSLLLDLGIQIYESNGSPDKAALLINEKNLLIKSDLRYNYLIEYYLLQLETGIIFDENELKNNLDSFPEVLATKTELLIIRNKMNQGKYKEAYANLCSFTRDSSFNPEPAFFQLYVDLGEKAGKSDWIQEGKILLYKYFPNSLEYHIQSHRVGRLSKPDLYLISSLSEDNENNKDIKNTGREVINVYDFYFQTGFFKDKKLANKQNNDLLREGLASEIYFDSGKNAWRVLVSPGKDPMATQYLLESKEIPFFKINKF